MSQDTTIRIKKTTKKEFKQLKDDLGMKEDGLLRLLMREFKK
jgi:antitoxin component of RelBE/YafQ-DinJ toxin-antitoxin module